jgi:hypothetical protein
MRMDSIEGSRVRHKPSGREGFYHGYIDTKGLFQGLFKPDSGPMEEVPLENLELIRTSGRPKVMSADEYRSRKTVGDANRVYNSD